MNLFLTAMKGTTIPNLDVANIGHLSQPDHMLIDE